MWCLIPSLEVVVQGLSGAFTSPSFQSQCEILLGWVVCLGRRTEFRVFETIFSEQPVSRKKRHPFDRFYNFFSRSAWQVSDLARALAVQVVVKLKVHGKLELIVDDTLLHKSGKWVFGIGWFHDGAASTKKREVTSLGNSWVVMGLAISLPFADKIFCLPIHAKLRRAGKQYPGPVECARQMLEDVEQWFPEHELVLIADGGYSSGKLQKDLSPNVTSVGLMRGDAALHNPRLRHRPKNKRGPKPRQGPRIDSPRDRAKRADRSRKNQDLLWKTIEVQAYRQTRRFEVLSYLAVWPRVFGQRSIRVVISRAIDQGYDEIYLFTTDLDADPAWVVETYAKRTSIEQAFKDSKQVLQIEKPQHWCQASIEKLAPWVWLMQTVITLWYLTDGRQLPEARQARGQLGPWETEWSLRHMCRLLRRVTIRNAIKSTSSRKADLKQFLHQLENYLYLAA